MAKNQYVLPELIRIALEMSSEGKLLAMREEFIHRPKLFCPTDREGELRIADIPFKNEFRVVDVSRKLRPLVVNQIEGRVTCSCVPVENQKMLGRIEFFDEQTDIYVNRQNLCWFRFSMAKELMQALLGLSHEDTASAERLFMGAQRARILDEVTENTLLSDEQAAIVLALEVLFPFGLREAQYERLAQLNASPYQIAKAYLIPEALVRTMFESDYAGLSYRINLAEGGRRFSL